MPGEWARGLWPLSPRANAGASTCRRRPKWRSSRDRRCRSGSPRVRLSKTPERSRPRMYGMGKWSDLFTNRQLATLTTLADLVQETREQVKCDALAAGATDDGSPLSAGGAGTAAYADALAVYLAFALDRVIDRHTTIATWDSSPTKLQLRNTFSRQALQMTWDFGEGNPFCTSSGTWSPSVEWVAKSNTILPSTPAGQSLQADASCQRISIDHLISTDPPYYDNVLYADLSDFFYVWLRSSYSRSSRLFATARLPKAEELVATPYRHGGKVKAEAFFLSGMTGRCIALPNRHTRLSRSQSTTPLNKSESRRRRRYGQHRLGDISRRGD